MGKKWIPLEANPEVLNEFAKKLGVTSQSFEFTDVYGLDPVGLPSCCRGRTAIQAFSFVPLFAA